jgi:hypothetical protein
MAQYAIDSTQVIVNGMEEVIGSIPIRAINPFSYLRVGYLRALRGEGTGFNPGCDRVAYRRDAPQQNRQIRLHVAQTRSKTIKLASRPSRSNR